MPITHTSQFDRASRRLYVKYENIQKTIGSLRVADEKGERIPRYLPVSLFLEGTDQYVETNGFVNKTNSVDAWQDIYFVPAVYGEIESVEVGTGKIDIFAADAPTQLLHSFNMQ